MTREDYIHNLQSMIDDKDDMGLYDEDVESLQVAIKALEQQPKTGHWITTGDYYTGAYGSIDYVKCSCCNEDSLEEGDYCPNCGAKMESEVEE